MNPTAPIHAASLSTLRLALFAVLLTSLSFAAVAGATVAWDLVAITLIAWAALIGITQFILRQRAEPATHTQVAVLMLLDAVPLTLVLAFTGGQLTPFSAIYLVYVALAALVLPLRHALSVSVATTLLYGLLIALPPSDPHALHHHDMNAHIHGMWVSVGLSAVLIVFVVGRTSRALAQHERALREARDRAQAAERLASVGTLAAGAAHELASPLSTIAVVANELQRKLAAQGAHADLTDDASLIAAEVDRCRAVLARLRHQAGDAVGEGASAIRPTEIVANAVRGLDTANITRRLGDDSPVSCYPDATASALRELVRNAIMSCDGAHAIIALERSEGFAHWRVIDDGPGMPPATLARATDPFFTTRPTGDGMGLGLFLAHSIAQSLGGELRLTSRMGDGVIAHLTLPEVSP